MSQQELPFTYLNGHSHSHVDGAADPLDMSQLLHNLLSTSHADTTAGTPVRGDIIVAMTSSPKWGRYALIVPAANVRNAFAVDNGETEPTWKVTLDATNPSTLTIPGNPAPGTSLIYSHRDHVHGIAAHNLLSTSHGDTVAASPVRGDIVVGNTTPAWTKLAVGASNTVLVGGTDPSYSSAPTVASLTVTGTTQLDSLDVNANAVVDGTLLVTGATTVGILNVDNIFDHDGTTVGFYGAAPVVQQANGVNLTNNVTAGGVNDTIANFTDLAVYANDAATIRNDIYQLARKLKTVNDALRTIGLMT